MLTRKKRDHDDVAVGTVYDGSWPPPGPSQPATPPRRRMPAGWKPEQEFDYLIVSEDFYVGSRYFGRASFVRRNDPIALKLLHDCPEWVHPVLLERKD